VIKKYELGGEKKAGGAQGAERKSQKIGMPKVNKENRGKRRSGTEYKEIGGKEKTIIGRKSTPMV